MCHNPGKQRLPISQEYFDSVNLVTVFSIILCFVLGFSYFFLSYDTPGVSLIEIIFTISLGLLLLISPNLINGLLSTHSSFKWSRSISFITLIMVFFFFVLGGINSFLNINFIIPIIIAAAFLLYTFFFKKSGSLYTRSNIKYAVLFIIFSFYIIQLIWDIKYQHPFFRELVISGEAHIDTLFHTAIANMIKTYHIPGTGINGADYLPYHWGSHWLFANYSSFLCFDIIKFYNLCYPVIFIPLFIKSFFLFVIDIKAVKKKNSSLKLHPLKFILFFLINIGIINYTHLHTVPYTSESYLVSLILVFLIFSVTVLFFKEKKANYLKSSSFKDAAFFTIFLPLSISLLTITKISIGYLSCGIMAYLYLRHKCYRKVLLNISVILCSFAFLLIFLFNVQSGGILYRFNVHKSISYLLSLGGFNFIFNYIWVIIFIGIFLWKNNLQSLSQIKEAAKESKTIEVEILILVSLLGILPGLLLNIRDNKFYFFNFQYWLGLGLTFIYITHNDLKIKNWLKSMNNILLKIILIVLALGFVHDFTLNFLLQYKSFTNNYIKIKKKIKSEDKILEYQKNRELFGLFDKLNSMKLTRKQKTCIYLPKSNKTFWKLGSRGYETPFIVPAFTGIAMIRGIPDVDFPTSYGYYRYISQENNPLSLDMVKVDAKKGGFSYMVVIEENDEQFSLFEIKL